MKSCMREHIESEKEKQNQGDHMENLIKIQECIDDFYLSASDGSKIK